MGVVRDFLENHYRHFNAREAVNAAKAYESHLAAGGRMLLTLGGAMSTAELGVILARMIRADKVHAVSCTGANLEEDVFNLIAHDKYELLADWRALSADMEEQLFQRGYNRVTDTCIPEDVMHHLEERLLSRWRQACKKGDRKFPYEYLYDLLSSGELKRHYQIDAQHSWLLAAAEKGIPVWSPGWEDSTTGNMFATAVLRGDLPHHQCVKSGTEQFESIIRWYLGEVEDLGGRPSPGFFQIGGGIAGDFAICVAPSVIVDLKRSDVPKWGYFCQISDAITSYGGYSGAVPNEKISWGKLEKDTPKFMVQSDATIVAPLIFAYLLDD
jgi:deoxyhypusine synthase